MVTEFCGFGKGVVGKKLPSDTTLNNMKKVDLIKLLHTAQHNYETLMWFYNNAVNANMAQLSNNGWIPCSERLPSREEYQKCNGQFVVSDGNRTYATYFDIYDTLKFGEPTMDKFKIDRCVIAWMSLPAPYQQKEGE